jgi:FAD/FMN-containing dehydrogenase/uncharacterized membrane protein YhaH (DUF805 family)/SAM-dependent methyltransferase
VNQERIRLFLSLEGRLPRATFFLASVTVAFAFFTLFVVLETTLGTESTIVLLPFFYWSSLALAIKRYHDVGKSGAWLFVLLVPVLGFLWVVIELIFWRGTPGENRYGPQPIYAGLDHLTVPRTPERPNLVNDVTALNPIEVAAVVVPRSVEDVQEALRSFNGPVSIGGGRFSMGGQTASPRSLHLDMRQMNGVLTLSPHERTVRVQTGIRWCDLQRVLDAHDLSVKIMQTYANFTVGGSLSVNGHGRYVGLGPLILSVNSISIVLADGTRQEASPTQNPELFYGAIGCYGALGVIVEAELSLAENTRVEQVQSVIPRTEYLEHFRQSVRDMPEAVFHNADLYHPHYARLRTCVWVTTDKYVTNPRRLMQVEPYHAFWRYFFWVVSETPFGSWRREHIYEPISYLSKRVHWRNYEANYDAAELEPATRKWKTYVLQEYFVPINAFDAFTNTMGEIFRRHRVNIVNVSIRHAIADPGSLLAWAREEVFAFVVYYKQGVTEHAKNAVGVWTRELIDEAIALNGAYYLPYQAHATPEQFHAAYPRARELFELKGRLDPTFRFRNVIWDTYYAPTLEPDAEPAEPASEFHAVFNDRAYHDKFYLFLQNIYRLYPEDRFHLLIKEACESQVSEEAVYRTLQARLPGIKPFLSELTYGLPSLWKQKREMARQTLALLGNTRTIDGYLEIGSTGRYISELQKHVDVTGNIYLVNDVAPSNSVPDMFERGAFKSLGTFLPLNDYAPLASTIATESLDVVTCFIGLHHSPLEVLDAFVASIARVLRPGGLFVVRDHDCPTPEMKTLVSLVHTVFNAGLGVPWPVDRKELRFFTSTDELCATLARGGFKDTGQRLLQANDPTDNTLMAFVKETIPVAAAPGEALA